MAISIVTNEDNMVMMARYPDKFFDLAIVDPEYGIGEDGRKTKGRQIKNDGTFYKKVDKRNGKIFTVKPKNYKEANWDNKSADPAYFKELFRVSKNQIIWGANHFISKIAFDSSSWIVWDKINGTTDFADCELAYTSFKGAVRQFRFMWNGFNQSQSISNPELRHGNHSLKEQRIHPTQKPIPLYGWILQNYAKQNDKILDTHLGSGSSRIVAHDLGFDFYGCELDKDYFDAQEKRFAKHISQTRLFVPDVIHPLQANLF